MFYMVLGDIQDPARLSGSANAGDPANPPSCGGSAPVAMFLDIVGAAMFLAGGEASLVPGTNIPAEGRTTSC